MPLLLRKLLFVLFFTVAAVPSAWALSCRRPITPTYQMQLHSIIFRGKPLKIEEIAGSGEEGRRDVSIEFEVFQALKGFKGDKITITCGQWYYDCRQIFEIGKERVVFASGYKQPHSISGCSQQIFGESVESLLKPLAKAMTEIDAQLGKEIEDPFALWMTRADLYEAWGDKLQQLNALKNLVKFSRVWTQLHQHLIAKSCTIERKFRAFFSKRVASLRMSFILQKKRSTIFLCA